MSSIWCCVKCGSEIKAKIDIAIKTGDYRIKKNKEEYSKPDKVEECRSDPYVNLYCTGGCEIYDYPEIEDIAVWKKVSR